MFQQSLCLFLPIFKMKCWLLHQWYLSRLKSYFWKKWTHFQGHHGYSLFFYSTFRYIFLRFVDSLVRFCMFVWTSSRICFINWSSPILLRLYSNLIYTSIKIYRIISKAYFFCFFCLNSLWDYKNQSGCKFHLPRDY